MTNHQLQYNINAKRSRKLCEEMERLVALADYEYKLMRHDSYYVSITRLHEVSIELDKIWDCQVELFEEIKEEYKHERKTAVMRLFTMSSYKRKKYFF